MAKELAQHTYCLPMAIFDAEYQFDRHKLTIYYNSSSRIDFRELVRDLYSAYKARIWMKKSNGSSMRSNSSNYQQQRHVEENRYQRSNGYYVSPASTPVHNSRINNNNNNNNFEMFSAMSNTMDTNQYSNQYSNYNNSDRGGSDSNSSYSLSQNFY